MGLGRRPPDTGPICGLWDVRLDCWFQDVSQHYPIIIIFLDRVIGATTQVVQPKNDRRAP
jgi:hypothetical protein